MPPLKKNYWTSINCKHKQVKSVNSVSYHPNIDSKAARRGMIYSQKDKFGGVFIFDGSQLFTTKMLPEKKVSNIVKKSSDKKF